MPRYIFPASTVTNATGAALRLTFYATSTTGRRETDLWTVSASALDDRIPGGVVLTTAASPGAYAAFAGPDDIDTLYVSANESSSRTAIVATTRISGDGGTHSTDAVGSAAWLKAWTATVVNDSPTAVTRDSNGVATSATVVWPDGTTGTFTATTVNATYLTVDAYTVTYVGATTKTVTQAAVTRDSNGAVTVRPALSVA